VNAAGGEGIASGTFGSRKDNNNQML